MAGPQFIQVKRTKQATRVNKQAIPLKDYINFKIM